ncbi:MAG: uracil-DNA glycosylase [Myxococcota bacterium]
MAMERDPEAVGDPMVGLHELVASAAELVRELVEEDVTAFERLPDATSLGTNAGATPAAALPPQPAPERDRPRPRKPAREDAPRSVDSGTGMAAATTTSPSYSSPLAGPVPWAGRRPGLEEVREHLGECTRCGLCQGRRTIVFGEGNPEADLLFVGEGPGEQEDRTGRPFVGRAGELLTQMIEKGIGIPRDEVYICNIVKCRPPQNRNPLPPEVAACRPFLDGQIQAVAPRVIVTLGKPAASLLLGRDIAITRVRGTWQDYQGIPLMPTLHPAYVLRQYTPENRRAVWEDLRAAHERSRG